MGFIVDGLSPILATLLANGKKNGDGPVYHALTYTYHRFLLRVFNHLTHIKTMLKGDIPKHRPAMK